MMRSFAALFVAGSLAALPALAQQSKTKTISNTNPAGSHTMTMTKSGQGSQKIMTKSMTNTEGNKVLTSSRTLTRSKSAQGRRHKKATSVVAKAHKRTRTRR
jgi:hypothetical protein